MITIRRAISTIGYIAFVCSGAELYVFFKGGNPNDLLSASAFAIVGILLITTRL